MQSTPPDRSLRGGFSRVMLLGLVLGIIFRANGLYGQEPNFRHYTVQDGLASMTVYHIVQDTDGRIWLATENGVNIFDGHEFIRLGVVDGLPENDVLSLTADRKDRIWLQPINGAFAYVTGGQVVTPVEAEWIPELVGVPLVHAQLRDGRMLIGTRDRLLAFDESGIDTLRWKQFVDYVYESEAGELFRVDEFGLRYPIFPPGAPESPGVALPRMPRGWPVLLDKNQGRLLHREDLRQIQADSARFVGIMAQIGSPEPREMVNSIYRDPQDHLWIATNGRGIYLARSDGALLHFLEGRAISMVTQDRGGNYWIGTLGQGLYFLPADGLDVLTLHQGGGLLRDQVMTLRADSGGNLFLGYDRHGVTCLRPGQPLLHHVPRMLAQTQDRITDLELLPDGTLVVGTDRGTLLIRDPAAPLGEDRGEDDRAFRRIREPFSLRSRYTALMRIAVKDQIVLGPNRFLISASSGVRSCELREGGWSCGYVDLPWGYALGRTDSSAELWIGTQQDLRLCELGNCRVPGFATAIQRRVTCLEPDRSGGMWIGTSGHGLFRWSPDAPYTLEEIPGLPSPVITALHVGREGRTWIGTDRGLAALAPDGAVTRVTERYTRALGLADDFVNDVCRIGDSLWVATPNGLSLLTLDRPRSPLAVPDPAVAQLQVRGRDTLVQAAVQLEHWQNSVALRYWDRNFTAVRYQYRLVGEDSAWTEMTGPEVGFPLLAAGREYELEVRAANARNDWSTPVRTRFRIAQVFYRTIWFWALIVALLMGGILLAFAVWRRNRERVRRKELVYQQQLSQMRLSTLKSQMNPHFIFNSLNSIQHLITEQEGRAATRFVSKFARLMRRVLDRSSEDFIPLREELEMCRLYLELESMRLMDEFTYELACDPAVSPDEFLVPAMIFQPFLENAIWHGLLPKESDRQLRIVLEPRSAGLRCRIEDNGIGRAAAQARKQSGAHVSRALRIFEERIALLNQSFGAGAFAYRIVDLPQGTRIEIELPVLNAGRSIVQLPRDV
ncbi:MAG: two-component regulator propeller domain-containing protein [Bacteroidota bacterium]